jgi:integrase/recombinase XerD
MLDIFRRHNPARCKHTSRKEKRCKCPIWIEGTTEDGRTIKRKSLKTRLMADAERKKTKINEGAVAGSKKLKEVTDEHQADVGYRGLSCSAQQKCRRLFGRINTFAEKHGLEQIQAWTASDARKFARTWSLAPSTERTQIELLRSVWSLAVEEGWANRNVWKAVKPPKETRKPTLPYETDEMEQIYAACDPMELAFVKVMRHTGLRIGDTSRLEKSNIKDGVLLVYQAKTDVPVSLPVNPKALRALDSFPHASETHYFWYGQTTAESIRNIWCDRLAKVFKRSGVKGAHSHRFRDTFAVGLLLGGMPLESVSMMLGHSSVRVTEKHYSPWVQSRQDKLTEQMRATWAEDSSELPYNSGTRVN